MTGLQALFSGGTPGGLHRWPHEVPRAVAEREALEAGWQVATLSTAEVSDKAGFLRETARAFAFPGWFGLNWDALDESLGDLEIQQGMLVLWEGWGELAQRDPGTFEVALDVLRQRAQDPRLPPFAVLLMGGGPDQELPLL